jgi:hypothetical protein
MRATLYKTLSNKQTPIELQAGQTIARAFPEYDLENAVIVVNGKIVKSDYVLQESDTVMIRLTPSGTVAVVAIIVVAVVAVTAGVVGGIAAYKAKQAAEEAEKELEKVKKLTNNPEVDNRPFLRGASNTDAQGNLLPFMCGYNFFTPYKLSAPFYKIAGIDGADEYTYMALVCGFNKQVIKKVSIDDIEIKTFNTTAPQEGAYNLDTSIFAKSGQLEIAQDGELLSSLAELNYKTVSSACNDEIPKDTLVAEGTKEYLTYTLDEYAKNVDVAITFPYGLYSYNDDNDKISNTVTITPQYSLDGGSTWTNFVFNNNGVMTNTFSRNVSDKELRFVAHKDFTLQDYATLKANGQDTIFIRVRSNGAANNTKIHNDCYVLFYQSLCFDPNKSSAPAGLVSDSGAAGLVSCKNVEDRERDFCTVLALRLKASEINEDKLEKINIITTGIARVWTGRAWSTNKTPTRNPAAWALEIETSDRHPASRRADSEIDLESFGEWYEHCEEKGYKFDYAVTQNTKKDTILQYIAEATGACIYWDINGRRAVAIDRPQENALAVYNPQNIISIQNKKDFGRRTDGLRLKYNSSDNDLFQELTYLVMREVNGQPLTLTDDSIIKDVQITGITTHEHIVKYARRLMAIEALRPKTTTIEVGNEGIFYTPFSKILIQDDSLKIGLGKGYIVQDVEYSGGYLDKIYIDGTVTFETGKEYGIIVNCYGEDAGIVPLALKVSGSGTTDTLQVDTLIKRSAEIKPEVNCIFSFGELDDNGEFTKVTTEYLINQINRSDKGFTLELVNYNEAIYETGTIPDYAPNITQKQTEEPAPIPADYVTKRELDEVIDNMQSGNIPVGKPDAPTLVMGSAFRDGLNLSCVYNTDGLRNDLRAIVFTVTKADGTTATISASGRTATYYFDRETDGYPEKADLLQWTVSARAVNIYGKESEASEARPVSTSLYGTWQLAAPVITKRESNRVITLYFQQPTRSDGLERYGNIMHRVQIKRVTAPADSAYYKPATSANPYESEENYKDGSGFVIAGESYAQTLPLAGQDLSEPVPVDTAYGFSVVAYNEASESPAAEMNAVAHATSIRDIVENAIGNAQIKQDAVTADKIYVRMLSAIQENLGYITGGVFEGTEHNRWALSTITLEDGSTRYEGAMRVGGDDEYFEVEPYNIVNGVPQNYHVKFKAGNFEIASQMSSINGILYIQENDRALDRTKISSNGTYYQHRETLNSEWVTIASSNVNGVMTKQMFSDDTLFITNQDMAERRKQGYDIGNAYLSSESKVYHFDTDIFDQNGVNDLIIEDAETYGSHNLVGKDNESDDIDFTPAILAIAPFATLGKSLYGRYGITAGYGVCNKFTVDFWLQYIYSENQIIFDIGNTGDKIKLIIAAGECYFEKGADDESGIPFNAEITQSRLYNALPLVDVLFNKASAEEIAFNAAGAGECPFESIAVKEFNANYVYYVKATEHGVEVWNVADVTAATYYDFLKAGLYEKTLPFNSPAAAHSYIQHDGQTQSKQRELSDIGVSFPANSWLHIGIIANSSKIIVALNDRSTEFNRYETAAAALSVVLNSSRNSFMLDELLIDTTTAESVQTFCEHTINRVPWANLSKSNDYFILTVKDLQNFKTNIFDTQLFKDKVLEVMQDYINNNTQE